MKSILIVDDELGTRQSLNMILKDRYQVLSAEGARQALKIIKEHPVNLIILDIFMEKMDGMELLQQLRRDYPHIEVIMLTAAKSLKTASEALAAGAVDYLVKPFTVEELNRVIERALQLHKLADELEFLRTEDKREYNYQEIVGTSGVIKKILEEVTHIADTKTPVLITGDTGTGKELIARAIHFQGARASFPFIAVHCASLPETLLESELFGHEKGAFTGAHKQKSGFFEVADGGSIFLDEIAEMNLPTQSKLLRVLEEGEFTRVGGTKNIRVDVRVITATNQNLKEMLARKAFREDLYYRINVIQLHLPPLRDRPEDIPILVSHFFQKFKQKMNLPVKEISAPTMQMLQHYPWPGNIREMKNVLERVLVLHGRESIIQPHHLPPDLSPPAPASSPGIENILGKIPLRQAVANFEKELIVNALQKTDGVQTRAAQLLSTTRRILKYRMDKLNIPSANQRRNPRWRRPEEGKTV